MHYVRPKQTVFVRETLQSSIRDLVNADGEIDLETDPSVVCYDIGLALKHLSAFPDLPPPG